MLEWLKEVHLTLYIFALEAEFGRPPGGRLDIAAAKVSQEAKMRNKVIVPIA